MNRETFDRENGIRTDGQIHLGPVNLDGMSADELVVAFHHPALHAEVRRYAGVMLDAYAATMRGDIHLASALERKADYIHDRLMPAACRW